MTRAEILALVALASSSYPSMQTRDPRPIVQAWSVMLADMDAVLAKTAIIKVCRESQFFPSVAQIVAAAAELDRGVAFGPAVDAALARQQQDVVVVEDLHSHPRYAHVVCATQALAASRRRA